MYETCAFSGHRNLKEWDFDQALLDRVVLNLIKNGTENFLCGMALGFDMTAAESVIRLKDKYRVKLTAVLPCRNQSDVYSEAGKSRYKRILGCCDEVIVLSEEYYSGCMHARDRYMVENCDAVVCFLRKKGGGTYYTVNYTKKLNIPLIEL